MDADLETIESRLRLLCEPVAGIEIRHEQRGDRTFLCLSTNRFGDHRHVRISAAIWYSMYWGCFHTPIDHDDDGDGDRRVRDPDVIVDAVSSFLIEGRRWQDIAALGDCA